MGCKAELNGLTINGFHWGEITPTYRSYGGPLLLTGEGADLVHIVRIEYIF